MTATYFKAVRPDGRDFNTGTIDYLAEGIVYHPDVTPGQGLVEPAPGSRPRESADSYLSVATAATDCTGFSWPARLLEVEAVGPVWQPHTTSLPNKRAVLALRVVRELDAALLFGHHGAQVQAIVERSKRITFYEARGMAAARAAAWDAAWDATCAAARAAARAAAWAAARDATGAAAWAAAWDAARAAAGALTRDLIGTSGYTQEHYDLLTTPWRKVIGPIHPDDPDIRTGARS